MLTPDDIDRMCQQAIANGADPVELQRRRDAAMREAGGSMPALAREMTTLALLEGFERAIGLRPPPEQEQKLEELREMLEAYPDEAQLMLATLRRLRKLRKQREKQEQREQREQQEQQEQRDEE